MVHFVQQVQYYINFEVLECSWDELLKKVGEAKDLDCIIRAHETFLDTIIARSFIDQNSTVRFKCRNENIIIVIFVILDCKKCKVYKKPFGILESNETLNFQNILAQLRTIFDLIINFQKIQDEMYSAAGNELSERQAYTSKQDSNTKQVWCHSLI